jgi:internalin A
MLLIGQGGVGKTSLVKCLMGDHYDPHEGKTRGIAIQPWHVHAAGDEIQLNVWDFGGQEIMHATHQFFLTRRSLYLLVLDARLDEEENRLEYWLKIVQTFGGDSPVIVVGNKVDQQPLDVDRRGLMAKYPNVVAILETSCADGRGIDELRAAVLDRVSALDHIHDALSTTWFAVKEHLESMEEDYIPYEAYQRLCVEQGIDDERSQRTLIGFLHDLGVVLNFRDDPRLEDTNVLNPEWVTAGVYRILNDEALMQRGGILTRHMLSGILGDPAYPQHRHRFIVDMMRKFELCFDFEGFADRMFLIPDLLPKEEPETGDWSDALAFQYRYGVLPSSIISRFIVRMSPYIHENTYWRNGVVVAADGNKALVKSDREEKQISIWVAGQEATRRSLLAIIRSHFGAIHATIAGIQAQEQVPLPNHPQVVVPYQHLLNLEKLGESAFVPAGLLERVDVQPLLTGVDLNAPQRARVHLRQTLTESFSEDELRTLCYDLGIPYEDFEGTGRAGKARELALYLERKRLFPQLLTYCREHHPGVQWDLGLLVEP